MKSTKKFFAIVTLVMFMMTLLPMAAFGAAGTSVVTITPAAAADAVAGATGTAWNFAVDTDAADAVVGNGAIFLITLPSGFDSTGATVAAGGITGSTGTPSTAVAATAPTTSTIRVVATTFTGANAAGDTFNIAVTGIGKNANTAGALTGASVKVYASAAAETAGTILTQGTATMIVTPAEASLAASKISASDTSKSADGSSAITATVVLRDRFNNLTTVLPTGTSLYVWAERTNEVVSDAEIITGPWKADGTTAITIASGATTYKEITLAEMGAAGANSDTAKVKFATNISGNVNLKAAIHTAGTAIATVAAADGNKIGPATSVTYNALGVGSIVASVPAPVGGFVADGTEYTLTFTVKDAGGNPLAGEVVQFSVNKTGAMLSKTEATTDILGQVTVKVSANKADTYIVTAQDGSITTNSGNLVFNASGNAFDIVAPAAITDKVAVNTSPNFDFKLYDVYNNQLQQAAITALLAGGSTPTASWVTKPSGASVTDSDLQFVAQGDNTLRVKLSKAPDKIGTYTFKVKLSNGKAATSTFEVATQGAIVKMTVNFNETVLAWGASSGTATVKYYDANNVYFTAANTTGISFSVDNANLATYNAGTGKIDAASGANSNYSTGTVTITAVDTNRNLVATDTITIGSRVASLAAEDVQGAVGTASTISFQIKDQDGKDSALNPANINGVNIDVYVVGKPAGASVTYDLPAKVDYQKSLTRTGKVDMKVGSDKAGDVTYTVVVTDGTTTISKTVKASFGTTTAAIGAKSVTMFIGATGFVQDGAAKVTDVAPFIKDSRTFVAVRPIADAFGAEIGWNEATQTVTLTRSDVALTIVIGQSKITKVVGGVTSEVTADVPAFIVDGRTVLPFRAVGEAFGATVNYDATTQAVSFTQN